MNKKVALGGAIAAVLIIIIAVVAIVLQPKKINLEDYVDITFSGYNEYAVARATLDESALCRAILEAKGKKVDYDSIDSFEALGAALSEEMAINECIDKITLSLSQDSNLSNGDTVTVEITYDNEAAKAHKVKFTGSTVTLKVEGLEDVLKVDPFEGFEVTFSGISPGGKIEYNYNGTNSNISTYSFSPSQSYDLKNGDIVTVTYSFNEDSMLRQGIVITNQEKEYEVNGLDEYVQSYADLTADFLNIMKSEAEDKIYSYVASNYNAANSMNDLSYAGYILNVSNTTDLWLSSYNSLYLIYTGTVSNTDDSFPATKVYYPVKFSKILNAGGELSYGSLDGIQGSSSFEGGWYTTKGYINPLLCYVDVVEKNRDGYSSECGDGFEAFAEYEQVTQLADISDGYKQELYADSLNKVDSYIANYGSSYTAEGLVFVGDCLLTAKNPGLNFAANNTYIVVYSALLSHANGAFEETTVYYPVVYNGIVSLPNGEYMVTESKGIQGSTGLGNIFYSTKGYTDGAQMFEKLVTANRDNYTYELSDGLKEFDH